MSKHKSADRRYSLLPVSCELLFFPNQACLWGSYSNERISVSGCREGGSPIMQGPVPPKILPPEGPKWVGTSRAQVGGPKPGPSGWAQAGPTWVGPSQAQVGWAQAKPMWVGPCRAQVGGPKPGPSQKFGTQKNPKNKNSQNQNPCRPKCRQGLDQ